MSEDIIKLSVKRDFIDSAVNDFIAKNDIELKDSEIYINGEMMGKNGFAAFMRFCYLMLASDDEENQRKAIDLLENINFHEDGFVVVTFCRILKNYRQRLTPSAEKRMLEFLESMKELHLSDYFDFQGVNDNFPMMATYYCMIYGELTNDKQLLETADKRFNQIEELLKLRGTFSEFCSVAYTALQLSVLASLTNDASNERYRQIALAAQLRVWTDYIVHFNPGVGLFCGPFSRTYTGSITGDNPSSLFFFNYLLNPDVKIEYGKITEQKWPYMVFASLYYLNFDYYITKEHKALLTNREYPFRYESMTEVSSSAEEGYLNSIKRDFTKEDNFYEYAGGETQQHMYMSESYGIGTATREFHNGNHTDSFFVSYRRKDKPAGPADVRNVFVRYIINEKGLSETNMMYDGGRKFAFQKDNTAMVLYKPRLQRDYKNETEYESADVSSLKLGIFLPKRFSRPDCIMLGDTPYSESFKRSEKPTSIYIKDGTTYMAFHPLCIDDKGRGAAIEIDENDEYIIISLVNYKGCNKKFKERDLLHIRNGFVCRVSSADECASFEEFVALAKEHTLTDEYLSTPHTRQTCLRTVLYQSKDCKLSCEYSPVSEGVKRAAADDRIITSQKFKATGFDENTLLYM